MAVPGLERCVRCDYDLYGLPDNHRCPECGLAYDEHTRVWRPATPLTIIPGVLIFGVLLPFFLFVWTSESPYTRWVLAGGVCWFVLVAAVGLSIRRVHRKRYVVGALPEGLLVRMGDPTLIAWDDLALAPLAGSRVRVRQVSSGITIDLTGLFRHKLEMRSFVDAVAAARAKYWQAREDAACARSKETPHPPYEA